MSIYVTNFDVGLVILSHRTRFLTRSRVGHHRNAGYFTKGCRAILVQCASHGQIMKFLESFKSLFIKKEDGTEKRREQIEQSLNAKILKDIKKEKAKKRLTIEDFDRFNQEEKEKEMRELIEKKRTKQKKEDMAKKRNKTLSANF